MPRKLPPGCVEDVDRYGKIRVYYRKSGRPKVPLLGTAWTPSFMAAYEAAVNGAAAKPNDPHAIKPGSWRWLCHEYFTECGDYKTLNGRFKIIRRTILESTCREPLKPGSALLFGDCPVASMTVKSIGILRDRKIETPAAANDRLKAMRQVFKFGTLNYPELVPSNPARDAPFVKYSSDGFYTWTVEDVAAYLERHPPGSIGRRAFAVLFYTGVRRQDAVLLGRQMVRDGNLRFKISKRKRGAAPQWHQIPVLPDLAAELARGPQDQLTWLVTQAGKPFTSNGFGNWFKDRCREAGLPQCSAHGIRKAGAVIAAENGASDAQLMAIYGWATVKMAAEYRKKADQKRLAAASMHLLSVPKSPTLSNFPLKVGQNSE